jgi:hypothetical protein
MSSEFSKSNVFEILELNRDNLARALSNKFCSEANVKRNSRFRYLLHYLTHEEVDVKMIIVENEYTDGDYLDDYSSYYVKSFPNYERRCKRLHLFSMVVSNEQFVSIVIGRAADDLTEEFKKAYKGYVIARPLPDAIIGRTALATYPTNDGRRHYPCIKKCKANLFGIELSVESLEYQQQDAVLAACATVSLWCCFHKTNELFQTPILTPANITRLANEVAYDTRSIPSQGLLVGQINNAIIRNDLVAEIIPVNSDTPLLPLLYGYMRFGLPVILGIDIEKRDLHAITLAGYSIGKKRRYSSKQTAGLIPFKADWIEKFYAHDDQIVPFTRIWVKRSPRKGGGIIFDGSWEDEKGSLLDLTPVVVIIPIYHKIRVNFIDVQKRLYLLNTLSKANPALARMVEPTKVAWDIHLISNNELKKEIKQYPTKDFKGLEETLLQQHPRFIWRAVLYKGSERMLELLADATDTPKSVLFYRVLWHKPTLKKELLRSLDILEEKGELESLFDTSFISLLRA